MIQKYLTAIICSIYIGIAFVPDLGGIDVMGSQWLYISIVNIVVFGYLFACRKQFGEAIDKVFQSLFSKIYLLFLLWALVSIFYAINATETLVCFIRLSNTFFIFIQLSILLYKKDLKTIFLQLSLVMTIVLLYEAIFTLIAFLENVYNTPLDENILTIIGNYGNKNVLAAGILIKIPFCIYFILSEKKPLQFVGIIVVTLSILALFILNTRSTYIGLFILFLVCFFSIIKQYWTQKMTLIRYFATLILPFLIAFFISSFLIQLSIQSQDNENGSFGTVINRLSNIKLTNASSSGRLQLWQYAIDFCFKHPILGCGYGNWKIASILYDKEIYNDLFVGYHAHNDFLEIGAELGIIGLSLFIGLFFILFLTTFKILRSNQFKSFHLYTTILILSIGLYLIDAFFNFPMERPFLQVMFGISCALIMAPSYFEMNSIEKKHLITYGNLSIRKIFVVVGCLILPLNVFVAERTFSSLVVQRKVFSEINAEPTLPLSEVVNEFPSIPNLATSTIPIKALIARYYLRDKDFKSSIKLLEESEKDNPYIFYSDFIRTSLYVEMNNIDSAFYFSKKAFYNRPRASSYYENILYTSAKSKDTQEIKKAFRTYIQYRNNADAWMQYFKAMLEVKGNGKDLLSRFDSAFILFPRSSDALLKTKDLLLYYNNVVLPDVH